MRMKRLKWASEHIENCSLIVKQPESYKGKWKEVLNKEKMHVEIGSGKGDYWIKMAQLYPNIAWIGVEMNESAAALATRKAQSSNLDNILFIYGNADVIDTWFDDKEVDVIHLNFSDPWPKKRNHKRRLSAPSFLKKYFDVLSEDGEIQMKTDNNSLFEFSIMNMQDNNFKLNYISVDFRRDVHDDDAISEYEAKFMSLNLPIYRAVWNKED